jgi:hypothetical protein
MVVPTVFSTLKRMPTQNMKVEILTELSMELCVAQDRLNTIIH